MNSYKQKILIQLSACILLITVYICCTGCSPVETGYQLIQNTLSDKSPKITEETIYNKAVDNFFTALDAGDTNAIRNMFSESVCHENKDLDEQINKLLTIYSGPITVNHRDGGMVAGEYSNHYGDHTSSVYSTFPVATDTAYYWCHFELMYENDTDKDQIGVTKILFFTEEAYCQCRYDDNWKIPSVTGLMVYSESNLDCEIRTICGDPYQYTLTASPLELLKVEAFFKTSSSYSAFVKQFGEPNAINIYYIYELPKENGKPRYLILSVSENKDKIHSAYVANDFERMYSVWDDK